MSFIILFKVFCVAKVMYFSRIDLLSKVKKLFGKRKIRSLKKLGKLIAFVGLIYQTISVTINYSKFETVIDMHAVSDVEQEPTFTFCLKSSHKYKSHRKTQNILKNKRYDRQISCQLLVEGERIGSRIQCKNLTKIVESVTPFSRRCLSYFSQLLDNKTLPSDFNLFFSDNKLNAYVLIHQNRTPPHFVGNKIEIFKSRINKIDYSMITTKLLPFPHSTDCHNYNEDKNSLISYRSKEDCFVRHLERKEFQECGCNRRWSYWGSGPGNQSNLCPESVECKFESMSKLKSLEKICKNNCLNEYYVNIISDSQYYEGLKAAGFNLIYPRKTRKHEIFFFYLPKMNFVEYLCSVGGLISMWFGISVYDLALIFAEESKKKFILLFGSFKFGLKIYIFLYNRRRTVSKINEIFSKITIVVFTLLMFYQIMSVINIYLDFEILTRFEISEIKLLPNIKFDIIPKLQTMDKLIRIYPEMEPELRNISLKAFRSSDQNENLRPIYSKYSLQLLYDNRTDDFRRIADKGSIIRTCHLKAENILLNCSLTDFGFFLYVDVLILTNYLNFSEIEDRNRIESITMRLNPIDISLTAKLFLSHSILIPVTELFPEKFAETTVSFTSFSAQKLDSYEKECIPKNDEKHFSEEYFDFCKFDCFFESSNQSFGCIPAMGINVYFYRYIVGKGYKLCTTSLFSKNYSEFMNFKTECDDSCKPKCNFINFDSKVEISRRGLNETVLVLVPEKFPRVAYIETLKTDINRMIYNCGGILGLWFGLSPDKAVDLFSYVFQMFKILIPKYIRILLLKLRLILKSIPKPTKYLKVLCKPNLTQNHKFRSRANRTLNRKFRTRPNHNALFMKPKTKN
jgi:hypothetical protein